MQTKTCSLPDCELPHYSRSYCRKDYNRLLRSGQLESLPVVNSGNLCAIDACETSARTQGLCGLHYQRYRKTGDPLGVRVPTLLERFWAKVERGEESECWEWIADRRKDGYGKFKYPGGPNVGRAHVFSYELHEGPVPDGLVVLHSCDNPPCVNPAHLSVGTQAENMGQMADRRRWPRKLTDEQMIFIRDSPEIQKVLARQFGISQAYVSMIKRQYRDGMHRSFTS